MPTTTKALKDMNDPATNESVAVASMVKVVRMDATSNLENKFKMLDEAVRIANGYNYGRRKLNDVVTAAFEKVYEGEKKVDTNPVYNNYMYVKNYIVALAMFFKENPQEDYLKWRNSKRTLHYVWDQLIGKGLAKKKVDKKAEKGTKINREKGFLEPDYAKSRLMKEAAEGVVNAEEYSKIVESKDKPNNNANEKKATSWTSEEARGGINVVDKQWRKTTKEILVDPASRAMFCNSLIKWATEGLIDVRWLKTAEEELAELSS